MEILIREFETTDSIGIFKLNRDEMGYGYPLEETRANLLKLSKSAQDKIYVAVAGEEVVGYVHVNDYDLIYAPHMKNIMGIAVSKNWKRKGVGRALLERAEEWARSTGAVGMRLASGASRTDAHGFYHNRGYCGDKMQLNLKKMF